MTGSSRLSSARNLITHPIEGRRLARAEYQATIAEGLVAGVARFLADTRRARTL